MDLKALLREVAKREGLGEEEVMGKSRRDPARVGGEGEEGILSGGGAEVGIHGGVGGAVSGDDDVLGEPDGETGGDDGAGCVGEVICIYPYVPLVLVRPPRPCFGCHRG